MECPGLITTHHGRYFYAKTVYLIYLIFTLGLLLFRDSDCYCQETADIISNWTRSYASDDNKIFFLTLISCGSKANSTTTYYVSKYGNAIIHFGVTDQVRFPGTHSVMLFTDASIYAPCNKNYSVDRAEIHVNADWRRPGRAEEGNTVWMGWSELWTDIDESHTADIIQFRSNCGTGSPACEVYMQPDRHLLLRTRQIPVYKSLGTIKEDVWYDWIVEIKYSKTDSGFVKVWLYEAGDPDDYSYSDPPTAQILNNPTMLKDDGCPHLRWGVYRWESGDKMPSAIRPEDHLMTKYIGPSRWKYGNNLGAAGFDAVKPRPPAESSIKENNAQGADNGTGEFGLMQSYPNPFNQTTTITFKVPEACYVNLTIYNQRGQLIRTLHSGSIAAGAHKSIWNGTDTNDDKVAGGVYFYRMKAKDFVATRKLLFAR